MESIKTFIGMNSDIAKLYQSNKEYLSSRNMRPVTTLGGSNGSLVNIKGNACKITFPVLRNVYKFKINKAYTSGSLIPGSVSFTVTVGSNTYSTEVITITEGLTPKDIQQYFSTITGYYSEGSTTSKFYTSVNSDYIYIYQTPEYQNCSNSGSQTFTVSVTQVSGSNTNTTISYVKNDESLTTVSTPYIAAISSGNTMSIIGSTYINDDIYIFTTFGTSNGTGQIWKLNYSEYTDISSIKLIYYNYINLNRQYPIPNTACIGRYETPSLQRIYWSDNYNPIRQLNVKDRNCFAIEPGLLSIRSSVMMNIPTLYNVSDIAPESPLSTGTTYQCAYRLSKFNGAISNYSVPSQIVTLTPQVISNFQESPGGFCSLGSGSSPISIDKTIKWKVDGIDTNYDEIEFVIITREYPSVDDFKIYKYETQSIGNNTEFITTFNNDVENFTTNEISIEEFLLDNVTFTHCKTMEHKDNIMFYGNTRNELSNYLESFDTRVFRFKNSTNLIKVKRKESEDVITEYNASSNYNSLLPTNDNIPVYNLDCGTGYDTLFGSDGYHYKYQKNSTIVGGSGPNINFKFGSILLRTDQQPTLPDNTIDYTDVNKGTYNDTGSNTFKNGYRVAGTTTNNTMEPSFDNLAPDQSYVHDRIKQSMGLEYFSGNYRTGIHNEIYRYGIVFYSKSGSRSYVKWIGDIKFPDYSDFIATDMQASTNAGNKCGDHRMMFVDSSGAYLNIPYIQFDVTVPKQLSDLIDGYEIVRVPRLDNDVTITSHSLVTQVMRSHSGEPTVTRIPHTYLNTDTLGVMYMDPKSSTSTNAYQAHSKLIALHNFEDLVNKDTKLSTDDYIIISEKYKTTQSGGAGECNPTGTALSNTEEAYYITKFFTRSNNYGFNNFKKIKETVYCDQGKTTNTLVTTGGVFKNYDYKASEGSVTSVGSPVTLLGLYDNFLFQDYNGGGDNVTSWAADTVTSNSKLLGYGFKPNKLKTQYGGRTYISRFDNEYISTGAYCKVTEAGVSSIKVFGGDSFYGVLDILKAVKCYNSSFVVDDSSSITVTASYKHAQGWFFPTQSRYNVDLRGGNHINKNLNSDDATNASGGDSYDYIGVYNYENSLVTHVPKPLLFDSISNNYNRIYFSKTKINGEVSDSWSILPTNNYYDVDGNYGPITALINLKNNTYCIQENAISTLLINPRAILQDQSGPNIVLGNGEILDKAVYIATNTGTKHQWSISKSNNSLVFVDTFRKKIYKFNGESLEPISDSKGHRGFINRILQGPILEYDNPIIQRGIITAYDSLNDEFLFTFHTETELNENISYDKQTLAFSSVTDTFTSYYDFTPYIYISNRNFLFSSISSSTPKLYLHNVGDYGNFYGTIYPSSVKTIVNENPMNTKVFDNLSWFSESSSDNNTMFVDFMNNTPLNIERINTLSRVRCYNDYQNTDWVNVDTTPITGNVVKIEQSYNMQVPRNKVDYDNYSSGVYSIFDNTVLTKSEFGERLRDKYLTVDLEYDNLYNYRYVIHNLKTKYRISTR